MTDPTQSPAAERDGFHPGVFWALLAALAIAEIVRRAMGHVPPDFSAYLAAADTFGAGMNPYTNALFDSPRAQGFPYVYPPGTLWVIRPLAWIPAEVASVADFVARAACLVWSMRWTARRFDLTFPLPVVVLLALVYSPIAVDLLTGNLAVFMLAAVLGTIAAAESGRRGAHAVVVALGFAIAFKPMWAIPAVFALVVGRRWTALTALGIGGGSMLGLSLVNRNLAVTWVARVQEVAEFYGSVDLPKVAPVLFPLAVVIWLGVSGYTAWRLRGTDAPAWLMGCVSLFAWPRLAVYSYVLLIPVLAYLVGRWGWRKTALFALPGFGPLPWMLRTIDDGIWERWLYFVWSFAVFVTLAWILNRDANSSGKLSQGSRRSHYKRPTEPSV